MHSNDPATAPGETTRNATTHTLSRSTTDHFIQSGATVTAVMGEIDSALTLVSDAQSDTLMVIGTPRQLPVIWSQYVRKAQHWYESRGIGEAFRDNTKDDTALFCAVLGRRDEHVIGGIRLQGPYRHPEESHAIVEWKDQSGQDALRAAIAARLPGGLAEVKTAFVDPTSSVCDEVAEFLARLALILMRALGVEHLMATAPAHLLGRWQSAGGVVDPGIAPTPYPDDRFQTSVVFWDADQLAQRTDPATWDLMQEQLAQAFGTLGRISG